MAKGKEGGAVPSFNGLTAPDVGLAVSAGATIVGVTTPGNSELAFVGIAGAAVCGAFKIFDGWL